MNTISLIIMIILGIILLFDLIGTGILCALFLKGADIKALVGKIWILREIARRRGLYPYGDDTDNNGHEENDEGENE